MSTRCGDGQAALQSCICRNTSEFNHVTSRINSDISSGCGTAAGTSDAWSASRIMDKYCHPESAVTFATPTANKVYASITEIPQISYLPSCAQSGLSYAVIGEVRLVLGRRGRRLMKQNCSSCPSAPGMRACTRPASATRTGPSWSARP